MGGAPEVIQIYVKTSAGKTITLDVEPTGSIADVKVKIQEEEGIPSYHQLLILNGKSLDDNRTVNDCNIQEKSIVYLAFRCGLR